MDFSESRTYRNLMSALQYELTTKALYDIYAIQAKDEQYIEIGRIYEVFSGNNLQHARIWLRLLNGGTIPSTLDNLKTSVENINPNLYSEYALIAREEGYEDIASLFSGVGIIDGNEDVTFDTLIKEIESDQVFCKEVETLWICLSCGNIMYGSCAPDICPVCSFPQGYYKVYDCLA